MPDVLRMAAAQYRRPISGVIQPEIYYFSFHRFHALVRVFELDYTAAEQ